MATHNLAKNHVVKLGSCWLLGFLLLLATAALAQMASEEEPILMEEVTVTGEALHEKDNPFTTHIVRAELIHDLVLDTPLRLIEQVPGLDMGAYRQGGVADVFSIRGFTGGGHGSDAAVYVDGIPLNESESHADGYADLNVLVPLELQKLTVHKGPSSPLYGQFARGGTLALTTRKEGEYQNTNILGGAYGTLDAQLALGRAFALGGVLKNPLQANFAYQLYRTDGYQDNARYLKGTIAGRLSYELSRGNDLVLSLRGHSGEWKGPGYIPKDQFESEERRSQQAVFAENDGGSKLFFAERLDYNRTLSDNLRLLLFGYATQQEFTRFAKFGYTEGGQTERFYNRSVLGFGGSLNGLCHLADNYVSWVGGIEFFSEDTLWRRWNSANRVRLMQTQERDFLIHTLSAFTQAEFEISPFLRPTLALRYDSFSGEYENSDLDGAGFTNDMNDFSHLSPKLGVRSTLLPGLDLRASLSNGYALPEGEAKYDPMLNVDPVEIWQYELGAIWVPSDLLSLDLAGFVLDTSNEILEEPIGSGQFKNVGKSRRSGLEGEISVYPRIEGLLVCVGLSLISTEILDNPAPAMEGKELIGVPERTISLSLGYSAPAGYGGRFSWRQVGAYYLTGDNRQSYGGYQIAGLNLFYRLGNARTSRWRLFLDVKNLFDEQYAEAVWYGYGTSNYAVGWPRHMMTGIAMDF